MSSTPSRNPVFYLFNIAITFILALVIFKTLRVNAVILETKNFALIEMIVSKGGMMLLAILLMPFNWFLETLKWHVLMKQWLSFRQSFKSIVSGVTIGLLTPMRVGEYLGRMLGISEDIRPQSFVATFATSVAQNTCNLFFGCIALCFLMRDQYHISFIGKAEVIFYLLLIGVTGLLYFHFDRIINILLGIKWIRKLTKMDSYAMVAFSVKLKILFLSVLRYLVYLSQYFLVLHFFGIEVGMSSVLVGISILFLSQSIIPVPAFLGLIARVELALIVWSIMGATQFVALYTTLVVWVINLCIPSLIGLIFILNRDHKT